MPYSLRIISFNKGWTRVHGFINVIAAIIVVGFYSTHCRLVRAFSSVNKHTCPLAIISVPIGDSFNSQYLVNILTTFLQRFAYIFKGQ